MESRTGGSAWSDQRDGPLGTRNDAQSTGTAAVDVRCVGSLAAIGAHPHLGERGQLSEVAVVDSPYLEHVSPRRVTFQASLLGAHG